MVQDLLQEVFAGWTVAYMRLQDGKHLDFHIFCNGHLLKKKKETAHRQKYLTDMSRERNERMASGDILRLFVIAAGAYYACKSSTVTCKKKMTEPFCTLHVLLSAPMIFPVCFLNPSQLDRYISTRGLILIIIVVSGILWGLWFISTQVSLLKRRNQEMAMQISLLNNDCEKILKELEKMKKEK